MNDRENITIGSTIQTPVGGLTVLVNDDVVVAAGFAPARQLWDRLKPTVRRELVERSEVGRITRLIEDYLDGRLDAIDAVPVDQPGTDLQLETWAALRSIPAGETRTYTELASMTSNPRAIRARINAVGNSPIPVASIKVASCNAS